MFELSGHAAIVLRELRAAIDKNDLSSAWAFLRGASFGSKTAQLDTPADPWPAPIHVLDGVRALASWMPGETRRQRETCAEDMYGHLTDFCHPNVGAFNQYVRFEERGDHVFVSMEYASNAEPPDGEALISVAAVLQAVNQLFGIYEHHPTITSHFDSVLEDIVESGHRQTDA
jgi:hypothetical protein